MPNGTSGGVGGAVERPPYPIRTQNDFLGRRLLEKIILTLHRGRVYDQH